MIKGGLYNNTDHKTVEEECMRKKRLRLLVGCLVATSLVLGIRAPGAFAQEKSPPPKATGEKVKFTLTKLDGTPVEKWLEKPKYGGELKQGWAEQTIFFDEALRFSWFAISMHLTNEGLLMGDWTRGPTGTGEASWLYHMFPAQNLVAGSLAESWEMPDANTLVFHIRKGVHFHNKPPTNGRQLDANDVVYSLNRLWDTNSALAKVQTR